MSYVAARQFKYHGKRYEVGDPVTDDADVVHLLKLDAGFLTEAVTKKPADSKPETKES